VVHKKYTYKNGKRFGPYYYETKRVNGEVVTTYLGPNLPKHNGRLKLLKNFLIFFGFILLILALYFISFNLTGNATLDVDSKYNVGEQIKGELALNLEEGEFIPSDSKLVVNYLGLTKEFTLSDLINEESSTGNFYVKGTSIAGQGSGFGGNSKEYPAIEFELAIDHNEKESQEDQIVEEKDESTNEEGIKADEDTTSVSEGANEDQNSEESKTSEGTITGAAISEDETIKGKVSKETPFTYSINKGDEVAIVGVYYNGEKLSDDEINVEINDGELTLTTEYFIEREGEKELLIELEDLDLIATENSILSIELTYDDQTIVEISDQIVIENENQENNNELNSNNQTINNETDVNNITISQNNEPDSNQTNPNSTINNQTVSNETIINSPILNSTLINQTQINSTEINTTEINQTTVNSTDIEVNVTQFSAVIGKPVRWVATVTAPNISENLSLIVEIPMGAENVSINRILQEGQIVETEETETSPEVVVNSITGEVSAEFNLNKQEKSWFSILLSKLGITGKSIDEIEGSETQEIPIEIAEDDKAIEVEYYTEAPSATETIINDNFKTVFVSSPEGLHYENVLVYTQLSDSLGIKDSSNLVVEWVEEKTHLSINSIQDLNADGNYDYIEWIAPHLSNQTFNIIVILDALHLDQNKTFISNIYNETSALDGIWSETIPSGDYVRVTFETNLTNVNDITLYPRAANGSNIELATIKVYEKNSDVLLAQFSNLNENNYSKIYLTNLTEEQDTFDLLIEGADLEFDHIIDPTVILNGRMSDVGLAPLSTESYVIVYVNASANTVQFQIKNTNGTTLLNPVTIATGNGPGYNFTNYNFTRVSVASINSTAFIIGWTNNSADWRAGFKTNGAYYFAPASSDLGVGTHSQDISLSAFNSTLLGYCFMDQPEGDLDFRRFNAQNGVLIGAETDVNAAALPEHNLSNIADCAAINSTRLIAFDYDAATDDDATYHLLDHAGTEVLVDTDVDAAVGNNAQVAVAALDTDRYALGWYDSADQDITIFINRTVGPSVLAATDVDLAVGTASRIAMATVRNKSTNSDNFVIVYYNQTGQDIIGVAYNGSGTKVTPQFKIEDSPSPIPSLMYAVGKNPATEMSLCQETWVVAYTNSTNNSIIKSYWLNGTAWDGICPPTYPPYNGTIIGINSSVGLNRTLEDISVNTTLYDFDNDKMNVTVRWYNNSVLAATVFYNNSYVNGSNFVATLLNGNTTRNHNWSAQLSIHDGTYTFHVNSSNLTIRNTPPNVTLISPHQIAGTTYSFNMSNQTFYWTFIDDDNDTISNLTFVHYYSSALQGLFCNDDFWIPVNFTDGKEILIGNGTGYQYSTNTADCEGSYYWKVKADDGMENSTNDVDAVNYVFNIRPNVTVLTPANQTSYPFGSTITFNWTVNETTTSASFLNYVSCVLYIDNVINYTSGGFGLIGSDSIVNSFAQTGFSYGTHFWNASCLGLWDGTYSSGLVGDSETRKFTINGEPSNGSQLIINSTRGLNKTLEDLNVNATLFDLDGGGMNVTVRWYNNSVLAVTSMYNSSFSNGTLFNASLSHFNTTKGQNWSAQLAINDGALTFYVNSSNLTILDTPPNVTLLTPTNYSISSNYSTQNFTWAVGDDDGNSILLTALNFSPIQTSSACSDPYFNGTDIAYLAVESAAINQFMGRQLECPSYLWTLRATAGPFSSAVTGDYATAFIINLTGVIPNVTINQPSNNSITTSTVSFNWTALDNNVTEQMKCNLTIDSVINKTNVVALNGTMVNTTVSGLTEGNHIFNLTCIDTFGNRGFSTTNNFSVQSNTAPFNGTSLTILSSQRLNKTLENLTINTTLRDLENNAMNVTVRWYNNSVLAATVFYNNSYVNGTLFNATLNNQNTTKGQNWSAQLAINDGALTFYVNSSNLTILNTPPNVTLISPHHRDETINRTNQTFRWAVSDSDGDPIIEERISINLIPSSTCDDFNYDGDEYTAVVSGQYSLDLNGGQPLHCLYDNNDEYLWQVRASDGEFGDYSFDNSLRVDAFISLGLNISTVEFGNLGYLKSNNTLNNSPNPILIVNHGNVVVDGDLGASNLWTSVSNPSIYYTGKFDNASTNGIFKNDSFDAKTSLITFDPIPSISSPLNLIQSFNYTLTRNAAEFDLNVTVPSAEGPGIKNSTIVFTFSLGGVETY
jgi:nitrogen fixation protein FixH